MITIVIKIITVEEKQYKLFTEEDNKKDFIVLLFFEELFIMRTCTCKYELLTQYLGLAVYLSIQVCPKLTWVIGASMQVPSLLLRYVEEVCIVHSFMSHSSLVPSAVHEKYGTGDKASPIHKSKI